MSGNTDNDVNREKRKLKMAESVWYKSVRLTINLIIHILIFLTVFVCLLFSCSTVVTHYELHIILCVLGFQFFMCQATLVMSPYNSWSMFLTRRYKRHIHWILQVIAAVLVTAGTILIIPLKITHFDTIHGQLGLAAFVLCLISLLNGIMAMYPYRLTSCIGLFWIRFFHSITGFASMFLGTGSLCAAYDYYSFRIWTSNGDVFVPLLVFFTWLFTILVSLDFWIITGKKIRNLI